jgi:hypothetical protein
MPLPRLRAAVANGNWSDSTTWNDGIVPSVNDVVALNNFNVTVNQDINVYQLTTFQLFYTSYNSFRFMTWNNEPEGLAESSFNDFRSYYPFSNGLNLDVFTSNASPLWYSYEYPNQESVVISRYQFQVLGSHPYDPKEWKFQGWNATTQLWEDLDSQVNRTNYGGVYLSNILSHTTAYYKYRIIVTQVRDGNGTCRLYNFRFYEKNTYFGTTTLQRGTADVNASRNINIGAGNLNGLNFTTVMRFSSPSGSVINFNGKIDFPIGNSSISSIEITGNGTYNFTGDMVAPVDYGNPSGNGINITQPCTVNFYGNVYGNRNQTLSSSGIRIAGAATGSTVNIFGNVEGAANLNSAGIAIFANINLNVYGSVYGTRLLPNPQYGSSGIYCNSSGANIVIVGNVIGSLTFATSGQGGRHGMQVESANRVEITGNVVAGTYLPPNGPRNYGLFIGSVTTLSIIGTIQASDREAGLISSAGVNLFEATTFYNHQLSGPFVSGPTGIVPVRASSFKLISNIGNYYQFRDLNLNSTSMVSPNTVVDVPSPQNVRQGTSYGSGNYVGSLAVPPTNRVSLGIPVDNTVGTAVLTADDVWNAQTSAMNTAGSIGKRLKNASTVDSTGDQLTSLL